jgi:hypothetical protein
MNSNSILIGRILGRLEGIEAELKNINKKLEASRH